MKSVVVLGFVIIDSVLPKAYVQKNMSGPFMKKKLIIRFESSHLWVLSYKRVRDGVAIKYGWKLVDEVYTQKIKMGRYGNQFFFGRDWVKVAQQIQIKFASVILFNTWVKETLS
ncbi:hypothetical protein Hanom_Chr05g00465681 [Helianthus anomalus]